MNAAGGSFSKVAGLVKLAPNIELTPTFDLSYDHCIVSHPSVMIISLKEIKGCGVELFSVAGFCCRTCGFKFHQKCAQRVPKLCQQVNTTLTISTDANCLAGENAEDLGGGHVGRGDRDGREHGGDHHAWQQ